MRIQTILNRVEKFKSFVHGEARLEEHDDGPALVIRIEPRKNSRPFCSGCGRRGRPYDRLEERRFEFVPIWGILVFWAYPRDALRTRRAYAADRVPRNTGGYRASVNDSVLYLSEGRGHNRARGNVDQPNSQDLFQRIAGGEEVAGVAGEHEPLA